MARRRGRPDRATRAATCGSPTTSAIRVRDKLLARSGGEPADRDLPLHHLTWDYPTEGPLDEPSADAVLREINGWDADGEPLSSFNDLADDGSTACGCWIYAGAYADGVNQTARRTPWTEMGPAAQEWGWAWPNDRRMLYNRASADPDGRPWSERKRYVWWDEDRGTLDRAGHARLRTRRCGPTTDRRPDATGRRGARRAPTRS